MSKSICELLLQFFPQISEFEDLYSTYVANYAFNSVLCYTAIMLNIVTIHAIRRTSSLPKTLKTLLLSLAVTDVGVGLLGQPLYISLLAMWLQQNDPSCNTYKGFTIVSSTVSLVSFFGVVAVSVDRFLAIHHEPELTGSSKIRQVWLLWRDVIYLLGCCHRKNFAVLLWFAIIAFNESNCVLK